LKVKFENQWKQKGQRGKNFLPLLPFLPFLLPFGPQRIYDALYQAPKEDEIEDEIACSSGRAYTALHLSTKTNPVLVEQAQ
jgi:hypothetical protein